MGCRNCIPRVQRRFLRNFYSQNHINWHCERKNSAGFVRTAFYFSEEISSKTVLLYYSLPHSSSMGCQNCILRVQRKILRNFFHRIILIGTVSEKIQLILSKLLSIFPGNFWAKQFWKSSIWFFSSLCQILQAWVAKIVFYVSRGTFCGILSQNHIKWHSERKNSAGFVRTAFYFSEELSSKTILVYYSLPDSSSMGCQNCIPRVQRHLLRNFFHRIIILGTVNEKKISWFWQICFLFFRGTFEQKILVF